METLIKNILYKQLEIESNAAVQMESIIALRVQVQNLIQTVSSTPHSFTLSDVMQLLLDSRQQQPSTAMVTKELPPAAPIGCETIGRTNGSAVYRIRSSVIGEPFYAFCMADESGLQPAWTVVLRRSEAKIDFYRNWTEYSQGFGNIADDHWIGLERLYEVRYHFCTNNFKLSFRIYNYVKVICVFY